MTRVRLISSTLVVLLALTGACAKKKPPVANPIPPPPAAPSTPATLGSGPTRPPTPPEPLAEPPRVPVEPLSAPDDLTSKDLDFINKAEALKPAFFALDGDSVDDAAQQVLAADAQTLKQYGTWQITIEGHCDERGSTEYNLALGTSRADAVKNALIQAGVSGNRIKIYSYGKEKPFCTESNESCWQQNRRGHFVYEK